MLNGLNRDATTGSSDIDHSQGEDEIPLQQIFGEVVKSGFDWVYKRLSLHKLNEKWFAASWVRCSSWKVQAEPTDPGSSLGRLEAALRCGFSHLDVSEQCQH